MGNRVERKQKVAVVLLGLSVLLVFAPLLAHPFLDFDDDSYVARNPHVASGLSWNNLVWAFTAFHSSNWHPLTWISHQIDVSLWGLAPRGHHMTSVLLHVANTLLVLLVLRRMTGAFWPSLFVAALFGLHPQRLESVAWVAERKDVLSGFFGLLTILGWARYAESPTRSRYALSLIAFALALSAKPMLVTLPFLLLLLGFWPLARMKLTWPALRPRLVELIPFFALGAASCYVTIQAQRAGGSIGSFSAVPFADRLANASTAYVVYLVKLAWPVNLALIYPLPHTFPVWRWAGASALLIALTAAALAAEARRPWLTVGWLWYLGTLIPVIGLIHVGTQAYADRYTYLPALGIGIALAWSAAELAASRPSSRPWLAGLGAFAAAALCGLTLWQGQFWSSSERLFERSLAVAPGSEVIHNNYGALLQRGGRREEALQHFRAAVAIDPRYTTAGKNLGNLLMELDRPAEAVAVLEHVVLQAPEYASGQNRLGVALTSAGNPEEALQHLRRAAELEPADPRWREDLVVAMLLDRREAEAIPLLDAAIAGSGATAEDRYLLGVARFQLGELELAAKAFEAALAVDPKHARALERLGIIRAREGRLDEAIEFFRRSLAMDPSSHETERNLAQAIAMRGGK
jgi:tetratricopeptide (TPR) repeat protein